MIILLKSSLYKVKFSIPSKIIIVGWLIEFGCKCNLVRSALEYSDQR